MPILPNTFNFTFIKFLIIKEKNLIFLMTRIWQRHVGGGDIELSLIPVCASFIAYSPVSVS